MFLTSAATLLSESLPVCLSVGLTQLDIIPTPLLPTHPARISPLPLPMLTATADSSSREGSGGRGVENSEGWHQPGRDDPVAEPPRN